MNKELRSTRRCIPTAPAWANRPSCSLPVTHDVGAGAAGERQGVSRILHDAVLHGSGTRRSIATLRWGASSTNLGCIREETRVRPVTERKLRTRPRGGPKDSKEGNGVMETHSRKRESSRVRPPAPRVPETVRHSGRRRSAQ